MYICVADVEGDNAMVVRISCSVFSVYRAMLEVPIGRARTKVGERERESMGSIGLQCGFVYVVLLQT